MVWISLYRNKHLMLGAKSNIFCHLRKSQYETNLHKIMHVTVNVVLRTANQLMKSTEGLCIPKFPCYLHEPITSVLADYSYPSSHKALLPGMIQRDCSHPQDEEKKIINVNLPHPFCSLSGFRRLLWTLERFGNGARTLGGIFTAVWV